MSKLGMAEPAAEAWVAATLAKAPGRIHNRPAYLNAAADAQRAAETAALGPTGARQTPTPGKARKPGPRAVLESWPRDGGGRVDLLGPDLQTEGAPLTLVVHGEAREGLRSELSAALDHNGLDAVSSDSDPGAVDVWDCEADALRSLVEALLGTAVGTGGQT